MTRQPIQVGRDRPGLFVEWTRPPEVFKSVTLINDKVKATNYLFTGLLRMYRHIWLEFGEMHLMLALYLKEGGDDTTVQRSFWSDEGGGYFASPYGILIGDVVEYYGEPNWILIHTHSPTSPVVLEFRKLDYREVFLKINKALVSVGNLPLTKLRWYTLPIWHGGRKKLTIAEAHKPVDLPRIKVATR